MNLTSLKLLLATHPDLNLAIRLPDGDSVPAHFCGLTAASESDCC
jgi:hypothetical protein